MICIMHGRTQPKTTGGQSSEVQKGILHAAADGLASEKGHLLAKRELFSTMTGGGGAGPPAPPLGTALLW